MNNKDVYECVYIGAESGSPAENSGLCGGDHIISINGKKINSPEDWDNAMKNRSDNQTVVVVRDNQRKEFTVRVNKIDPNGKLMN